jgi:hypothetical protein
MDPTSTQLVVNLLREILQINRDIVKKGNVGPLTSFLSEAQNIIPDISRIDAITFWATINAPATIVTQATQVRVNPDYDFLMYGISGFVADPATNPTDLAAVTFQMRAAGLSADVFTTPINMAQLAGLAGPASMIDWGPRGVFCFDHNVEIVPTFAIGGLGIIAHATRTYGVTLYGTLIRKKS